MKKVDLQDMFRSVEMVDDKLHLQRILREMVRSPGNSTGRPGKRKPFRHEAHL